MFAREYCFGFLKSGTVKVFTINSDVALDLRSRVK